MSYLFRAESPGAAKHYQDTPWTGKNQNGIQEQDTLNPGKIRTQLSILQDVLKEEYYVAKTDCTDADRLDITGCNLDGIH